MHIPLAAVVTTHGRTIPSHIPTLSFGMVCERLLSSFANPPKGDNYLEACEGPALG